MERAIFISKLDNLKYLNESYKRLYFGNEFCQRLIPTLRDLRLVLNRLKGKNIEFSLVTPYATDVGVKKLEVLFKFLNETGVNYEVIINDWGVLNLINLKYFNLVPVLGRLLTKQQRGPELKKLLKREAKAYFMLDQKNYREKVLVIQKKLPSDLDFYYKGSNASSVPIIQDFLFNLRVRRIELDNTLQGLLIDLQSDKIAASIYLPYIYITTTFFCPTAGCKVNKKNFVRINPCNRPCLKYLFKLQHKDMPKKIFLKGNSMFYKNSKINIDELERIGINRIVLQPEVPF